MILLSHGATIDLRIPDGVDDAARSELVGWVERSADTVGRWYGAFPVASYRLEITLVDGDRPGGGATTWPGAPPHSTIPVGRATTRAGYDHDWVLVHELTHLAFPSVADEHHWIEEGLATYLEPWERVAAGRLSAEEAWHDFVRDAPQGLGGKGLDRTHGWAATYWGGAVYCLLVDLEIRERTGGKQGLHDAVAAIAKLGGMAGPEQDLAEVLAVGDKAVGVPALTDTWTRFRDRPLDVDLGAIWTKLGVALDGDTVRFDDAAPEAAIRRAITQP